MEEEKITDLKVFEYAKKNNWLLDGGLNIQYLRTCILDFGNIKYIPKYIL